MCVCVYALETIDRHLLSTTTVGIGVPSGGGRMTARDCANGADMKTTFYHVEVPISITFTIQIDFENCVLQCGVVDAVCV